MKMKRGILLVVIVGLVLGFVGGVFGYVLTDATDSGFDNAIITNSKLICDNFTIGPPKEFSRKEPPHEDYNWDANHAKFKAQDPNKPEVQIIEEMKKEYKGDDNYWGSQGNPKYEQWDEEIATTSSNLEKKGAASMKFETLTKDDGRIDAVKNSDTYEHLEKDKQEKFLKKAIEKETGIEPTITNLDSNNGWGDKGVAEDTWWLDKNPYKMSKIKAKKPISINIDGKEMLITIDPNDGISQRALPGSHGGICPIDPNARAAQQQGGPGQSPISETSAMMQALMGPMKELGAAIKEASEKAADKKAKDAQAAAQNKPLVTMSGDEFEVEGGAELVTLGQDKLLAQNCYAGAGANGDCDSLAKFHPNAESYITENALIGVLDQVVAYTPNGLDTELLFNGISGDAGSVVSEGLSLYGSSLLTAAVISDLSGGQYVKLIGHDLELSGERIVVDVLKTFEEVTGQGGDLWVKNGDMYMKFNGPKFYYSRLIRDSPHSMGNIANGMDSKNRFKLLEYEENKGRLLDGSRRVSIGDMIVEHPRKIGLKIARVREDMWVER